MKIIIADDHLSIRFLYKEILSNQGHDIVAEADNGLDAITSYFENEPDLLIIDNHMGALNGIDVVRHIKQKDRNAKILMCTSSVYEVLEEATELGVKEVLSKPFSVENFIESVRKAIHD